MATKKSPTSRQAPTPSTNRPADLASRQSIIAAEQWSGPLPPPQALAKFDEIIANGAERIMTLVETEQAHRHAQERKALIGDMVDNIGGKILGAALSMVCIGGAIYLAITGAHYLVALGLIGFPICGLIGKFLIRRK
jgi:uncharacterized membrane protein